MNGKTTIHFSPQSNQKTLVEMVRNVEKSGKTFKAKEIAEIGDYVDEDLAKELLRKSTSENGALTFKQILAMQDFLNEEEMS